MKKIITAILCVGLGISTVNAQTYEQDSIAKQKMIEIGQNQLEGKRFLRENGKRPEVKTTISGLQYEITHLSGKKKSPSAFRTVTINYTGYFVNGDIFDQGENVKFNLQDVVKGFSEGIQYMHIGDKAILYIPPYLGYGNEGFGPVPPQKTLIFEVELVDF